MTDPWLRDRLGYKSVGEAFTNLIKTIDTGAVISIEAGFGRGKTFFREAWSEHLRQSGEVVVEVDVLQSDHSGDPVVTLLGCLLEILPREDAGKGDAAIKSAKKLGAIAAKSVAKAVLRSGAEELIELATENAIDKLDDFDVLDKTITELGEGMSKAAGKLIATQMAAEKVRKDELPMQLESLRSALLQESKSDRIIIIIDELDRCHPDYAIAVLEALKLVFKQSGFVFFLMINADYLERLAQHRFGVSNNDERYLDKFVDIRLRLEPPDSYFKEAVIELATELPLAISYGDSEEFSVDHAAKLAGELAVFSNLSMRKVKAILLKVELALRCYSTQPIDLSLLIFLSFRNEAKVGIGEDFLPRSFLTPELGETWEAKIKDEEYSLTSRDSPTEYEASKLIKKVSPELLKLPMDRYGAPENKNYKDWAKVFMFLAPHYIPDHLSIMNAAASFAASDN